MRWFYVIALVVALGLGLLPLWLIAKTDQEVVEDMVAQMGTGDQRRIVFDTYSGKIRSKDPATCGDLPSATILANVFESLYQYDYLDRPKNTNWEETIRPLLADGLPEVSADKLVYTIHIKKGVKYRRDACFGTNPDDTPKTRELKAEDFVLGFKRIADPFITTDLSLAFIEDKVKGVAEYREQITKKKYAKWDFSRYQKEAISGIEALDDYTLRITLSSPHPRLMYVLAMPNYTPIPRELVDYYLAQGPPAARDPVINDYHAMVGTGPYFISDFVDGGHIILERNPDFRPDYYPKQGAPGDMEAGLLKDAGKQVPFVDMIFLTFAAEQNSAWTLFLKRQSDLGAIPNDLYGQVINTSKDLNEEMRRQGIKLIKYRQLGVYWFTLNMDDPVLGKSKSLRQALCLAFSVEDYLKVLLSDRGVRAVNIVPASFEGHDEAGPCPYARFDLAEARKKIVQAKQELVAAGVIQPGQEIPTLKLDLGNTDESTRRFAEFTLQQFEEIGLHIKPYLQDFPTLLGKMRKKQCQIYYSGWHADYPDAENFLQLFYSGNVDRGTNNSNYRNAEFDKLYTQAVDMQPSKERLDLYVKMIRMINEDCPIVLLTEPVAYLLTQPWVRNVKPHPLGYGYFKYRFVDPEARRNAGGR